MAPGTPVPAPTGVCFFTEPPAVGDAVPDRGAGAITREYNSGAVGTRNATADPGEGTVGPGFSVDLWFTTVGRRDDGVATGFTDSSN